MQHGVAQEPPVSRAILWPCECIPPPYGHVIPSLPFTVPPQHTNTRQLEYLAGTLEDTRDELAAATIQAGSYHNLLLGNGNNTQAAMRLIASSSCATLVRTLCLSANKGREWPGGQVCRRGRPVEEGVGSCSSRMAATAAAATMAAAAAAATAAATAAAAVGPVCTAGHCSRRGDEDGGLLWRLKKLCSEARTWVASDGHVRAVAISPYAANGLQRAKVQHYDC